MTHHVSPHGIVGLGALGRALETFLEGAPTSPPPAVLFTVKAFDLERALREQATRWPVDIPFVTLCNGYIWPVIEKLGRVVLGHRPIRLGMTTLGSTVAPDGSLRIFSEGSMTAWGHVGTPSQSPTAEELSLLKRFPNGQWHDDMGPWLRQKWIFNVVINTMAAAYRLPNNGQLRGYRDEVEACLSEACDLAKIIWTNIPSALSEQELSNRLWQLIESTSKNENSMARDVRLQRPTESAFLAGISMDFDGFPALKKLHKSIDS
jgi:ketopantoate reductase